MHFYRPQMKLVIRLVSLFHLFHLGLREDHVLPNDWVIL